MSLPEDARTEVIERLVSYVLEKLPHDEAPLVKDFIHQYYLCVSPEDITSRSIVDLYSAMLSHWNFIYERKPNECKVRVYNPSIEQEGWISTHTVIEVSCDDMPFLVDSISMELNRLDLNIHLIIHMGSLQLRRNAAGKVTEVLDQSTKVEGIKPEAAIFVEIDRQSDPMVLQHITDNIIRVLSDVRLVVQDWPNMSERARLIIKDWEKSVVPTIDKEDFKEYLAFLKWLVDEHFIFMGYCEDILEGEGEKQYFKVIPNTELGLLKKEETKKESRRVFELSPEAKNIVFSNRLIIVGKTELRSTVHRPAHMDFVSIKRLNQDGQLIGEHKFIGLFTAVAYNSSPQEIPFLRRKVAKVIALAGFPPRSHDDRALLNILETLPRDDLFQANVEELLELSAGILHLQERQKIRLFIRKDIFGIYFSCLVFVPREAFTSQLREKMQDILMKGLNGIEVNFSTRFSDSVLARIHFVIRIDPDHSPKYDLKMLEHKLAEAGRTWKEDLKDALLERYGEEKAVDLLRRFGYAFPAGYCETFPAKIAVVDIEHFEKLSDPDQLITSLYRPLEEVEDIIRFKLYRKGSTIPLSDVVPILENMGLRIISERPYAITMMDGTSFWVNDYRMYYPKIENLNMEPIKEIFQDAFDHVWRNQAESDGFNHLILGAKLSWREIMIIRSYAKYLWQTGFTFSQDHIEETFTANGNLATLLIELFKYRFDIDHLGTESDIQEQKQKIENALENVSSLSEDRILRRFMDVIFATLRTNYYQIEENGQIKPYFSFKIDSAKMPELPSPVPLYEIFVYSPRVEAIHLRMAKVARGGIRWSDRREDFRTEILGLMKTQQVKNAVIVPMGAKGGFVVKRMPLDATREQLMDEVVYCYQTLIRGLLDLTDNYKGEEVIPPKRLIRYDDNDPYLVVAADKGTATFSDLANTLSEEYDFWLGDAFASGGKTGYDHKKMGITARGAWESVKRHFLEFGVDTQTMDFTVFGIGDMSGDVFGNGMLLSKHIKLVAAFNHLHIFLDPNPDPEKSFMERKRLFELPRSSWSDYNSDLISTGGGVFSRMAKSITLSPEIQAALEFPQTKVTPNELIRAILKAPVDLFWNGGIGTYVKSGQETNLSVGDRTNDAVRINGFELRCRVVGEGGNLGLTQYGRIEYAKLGGRLNTDAIDNSGGVNCSDNEVNIKILLNDVVESGDLTEKQRNQLLMDMQEEVAELVLNNNRRQTDAITLTVSQAVENLEMHRRLLQEMEKAGNIDRALECLPDKEEFMARKAAKQGLTRPEIAVLMAYTKTLLKKALLASDLPDEPYFHIELEHAFPKPLQVRYKDVMLRHRLKREIIATELSNETINEMGISFVNRLQDETGSLAPDIIRAYTVSRSIFDAEKIYNEVEALTGTIEASLQVKMLQEVNRLIRRGARWLLRNRRAGFSIEETIQFFTPQVAQISTILSKVALDSMQEMANSLIESSVPEPLAYRIGGMSVMFSALDIIEAATLNKYPIEQVAAIYFAIGRKLELGWFRELIKKHSISNHWEALARASFRDDLDRQQRNLTIGIMNQNGSDLNDAEGLITLWLKRHPILARRWEYFLTELKSTPDADFTMFAVALQELLDMAQAGRRKKKTTNSVTKDDEIFSKDGEK